MTRARRFAPERAARAGVVAAALAAALAGALAGGCAHGPAGARPAGGSAGARRAPATDSITTALWHFDETVGTRAADSGPFALEGIAGLDTHTDFGRVRGARVFEPSLDSFVYVAYNPVLATGGGFSVEAWIQPTAYGDFEDTPIAARWTPRANQQSWLFGLVGRRLSPPAVSAASPGDHVALVQQGQVGALMFAYVPADAGAPKAFTSNHPVLLNRWTHVAATSDGSIVRLYVDGLLDGQFASPGAIRASDAPLIIGNYLDPRLLSDFGGDLRVNGALDSHAYYAFQGLIDEVRLSSAARLSFPEGAVR
jgi:Concanavalin A-like lectin/glucanases superfamily